MKILEILRVRRLVEIALSTQYLGFLTAMLFGYVEASHDHISGVGPWWCSGPIRAILGIAAAILVIINIPSSKSADA